jgi:Putative heavy-metal-binding
MRSILRLAPVLLLANAAPEIDPAIGVPVYPGEIRDKPYTVIGEVRASAGKATPFSHDADQAKLYRALWKRAQKMGADAVIKVRYGDAHVSAFSWGKTNVTGTAIRFAAAPPR